MRLREIAPDATIFLKIFVKQTETEVMDGRRKTRQQKQDNLEKNRLTLLIDISLAVEPLGDTLARHVAKPPKIGLSNPPLYHQEACLPCPIR